MRWVPHTKRSLEMEGVVEAPVIHPLCSRDLQSSSSEVSLSFHDLHLHPAHLHRLSSMLEVLLLALFPPLFQKRQLTRFHRTSVVPRNICSKIIHSFPTVHSLYISDISF